MKSDFLNFTFHMTYKNQNAIASKEQNFEINLLPYTHTFAEIYPKSNELFIGEERSFQITTNYPENIVTSSQWKKTEPYDYRIVKRDGKVFLNLLANRLGKVPIKIPIRLFKPFLNTSRKIDYRLIPIEHTFRVKKARLIFS